MRFNPSSGQKEPITSDERRAPAIWNMATWAGRSVGVFGLWATYPAEPVKGLMVSDRLFTFLFKEAESPAEVVFPHERDGWARSVVTRVNQEVNVERAEAVPAVARGHEYAVGCVRRPVCASGQRAATYPDRDPCLRRAGARFDRRARPGPGDRLPAGHRQYRPHVCALRAAASASIDRPTTPNTTACRREYSVRSTRSSVAIGSWPRRREASMLASDHGFAWGDDRPSRSRATRRQPPRSGTAGKAFTSCGGPASLRGAATERQRARGQVCATLLALSGLPPSLSDKAGALPGTPGARSAGIDYAALFHPAARAAAPGHDVDEDALKKLRSLGYVAEGESATARRTVEPTRTAGSYNNEGLVLKARAGRRTTRAPSRTP